MKIMILLNEPYPIGMACTNRIHLYAQGLIALGNDVEILIPRPTEQEGNIKNILAAGVYEGVRFRYAYKTPVRSKQRMGRIVHDIRSILNSFFILTKYRPEIILLTGSFFRFVFFGKIFSFVLKAKFIRESSEVPYFRESELSEFKKNKLKIEYRLFDGLIVISERLQKFYSEELALKIKILNIPILVNSNKINGLSKYELKKLSNFVYTGSLIDSKDGVLTIIKAFSIVQKKKSHVKLTMTGDIHQSPDKDKILSLIHQLHLKNKIVLTGYVSKRKLEGITLNAVALLLAKPENRQNHYNMATKIGEYLLTGRPVVVSSVDSACQYLSHRQSAFIVNPDEHSIAKELKFILDYPEKASEIGMMGKKVVLSNFDYKRQMSKMYDFFKELSK